MEPSLFPGPGLRVPASWQISQEHRDGVKVKDVVCVCVCEHVGMWQGVIRGMMWEDHWFPTT